LTQKTHITDLAIHPSDSQTVFATSPNSGLFKTGNGGSNWERLDSLPAHARPRSIAIHPLQADILFVGTESGGLYRSGNNGETWEPLAAGLPPEATVSSILFNPVDPNQMFFADLFSGVYRSEDGGQTWFASNEGLRTRAVNALAFSSDGLHLYAATEGEGVYRLDLNGQPPEGAAAPLTEPGAESVPAGDSRSENPEGSTPTLPCLGSLIVIPFSLVWYSFSLQRRKNHET